MPVRLSQGIELEDGPDSSCDEGGLNQDDPVRLREAGSAGNDDGRCDAADNHGDDVLQG